MTQQEMFVVFLGKTLYRRQRVIPPEHVFSRMEVTATQRLDWDQSWDFHPQDTNPIGVEDLVL